MTAAKRAVPGAGRIASVAGVLLLLSGGPSRAYEAQPGHAEPMAVVPTKPACVHTWDLYQYGPPGMPEAEARRRSMLADIPEYHDCQRLVNPDGKYGPLVVAFARQGLDRFGRELTRRQGSTTNALAAIEILNVDTTEYVPLGLKPGFSCLFVARNGATFEGKLVTYGYPRRDCTQPVAFNALQGLAVSVRPRPTVAQDYIQQDFPPVARWEWDSASHHQYLGFKCDDTTWCEAGLTGFVSAPALPIDPNLPRYVRRTFEIRGWLDEQVLATVGPNGRPIPTGVRGTVIPAPRLRTSAMPGFHGRWVLVNYVLIDRSSSKYEQKLNFIRSTAVNNALDTSNTSSVSICRAEGQQVCEGAPTTACAPATGNVGAGVWWSRFDAPGRRPIYKCVAYRHHPLARADVGPGEYTLGTARWRWRDDDELTWVGCPDGCCESTL